MPCACDDPRENEFAKKDRRKHTRLLFGRLERRGQCSWMLAGASQIPTNVCLLKQKQRNKEEGKDSVQRS